MTKNRWQPHTDLSIAVDEIHRIMVLMRTENIVTMAEVVHTPLDPLRPVVVECFTRSRETAHAEAIALHEAVREWAISIKAFEYRFNRDSDCTMANYVVPAMHDPAMGFRVTKHTVYTLALPR